MVVESAESTALSNGLITVDPSAVTDRSTVSAAVAASTDRADAASVPSSVLDATTVPASRNLPQATDLSAAVASVQLAPTRGQGATFVGSMSRPVSAGLLSRYTGRALLDQLSLLPTDSIAGFVNDHPESIARLLAAAPSSTSVARWWTAIPAAARVALIAGAPEVVGNLDGLDIAVRDRANRTFLQQSITEATRELPHLGRAAKADAEKRLHMLQEIDESLAVADGAPERSLLSVDTAWPGRAAVVVGDLQTADYVSYMVPGMFFTVDGQIVDWTVISQDLYDEQARMVDRLAAGESSLAGASVAVVSWIGYRTPGVRDVVSLDLAEDGAKYISSSVSGLHASRADDEPYVTLVTHSYGSTATMMAMQDGRVTADALVIIGSPGSAAQSVDDLGMSRRNVFVGEAAADPVVHSAFFGSDPGSASFGASSMDVAAETDPVTGQDLSAASGHLGYFDAGTTAMRNMALVGLDQGDLVTGTASDPGVDAPLAPADASALDGVAPDGGE